MNIEKAKQLVNSGEVKGFTGDTLKYAANNNPQKFKKYLSEIAEQAQDEKSSKATIQTYGQKLIDIALEQKFNVKNN